MPPSSPPASQPSDLELAALVSSRICHDIINPVGAIFNGLEMLDEEDDPKARAYALHMIRNVTEQASARLKFARLAYGANKSAGDSIDIKLAEEVSRDLLNLGKGQSKHALNWRAPVGYLPKDHIKLLLNLVALAITALPKGGDIDVLVAPDLAKPSFLVRCRGAGARPPQYLQEFLSAGQAPPIDSMTVQAYFALRIAQAAGMRVEIVREGNDVVLAARA